MKPNPNRSMWVGGLGAGFAVLCCFIPIAVIALGAAGAGAALAWLDVILFPVLFLFTAILITAWLWNRRGNTGSAQNPTPKGSEKS